MQLTYRIAYNKYDKISMFHTTSIHLTLTAWGQPPVSIALIRSSGNALFLTRNSVSSFVKISLVTAAIEYWSRSRWHKANMSAVLPDPTGLLYHHHQSLLSLFTRLFSLFLPANTNSECTFRPIAILVNGLWTFIVQAWMIQLFVGMTMFMSIMRVRMSSSSMIMTMSSSCRATRWIGKVETASSVIVGHFCRRWKKKETRFPPTRVSSFIVKMISEGTNHWHRKIKEA